MSAGQFINQHSFTIVGGAALVLLAVALLRDGIEQGEVIGRWAGALDPGQVRVLLENP